MELKDKEIETTGDKNATGPFTRSADEPDTGGALPAVRAEQLSGFLEMLKRSRRIGINPRPLFPRSEFEAELLEADWEETDTGLLIVLRLSASKAQRSRYAGQTEAAVRPAPRRFTYALPDVLEARELEVEESETRAGASAGPGSNTYRAAVMNMGPDGGKGSDTHLGPDARSGADSGTGSYSGLDEKSNGSILFELICLSRSFYYEFLDVLHADTQPDNPNSKKLYEDLSKTKYRIRLWE